MADLIGRRPFDSFAWSQDLNIETVRRIDAMVQKGEQSRGRMEAEVAALANEERLYTVLINGPEGKHGWKTHRQPLHRLEEINPHVVAVIREQSLKYPLTSKVLVYGDNSQIEWWQTRHPAQLSEEELYSDPKYIALYDAAVARGECSPRVKQTAAAGMEPTYDDRLQWVNEIDTAMTALLQQRNTYQLRSELDVLVTGLKNFSLPTYEAIDLAFTGRRMEDGIETGDRVAHLAEAVATLGRLVEWLNERQKAA